MTRNLAIKRRIFAHANVHLAAPSQYLVDGANQLSMVPEARTHVLRNAYSCDTPLTGRAAGTQTRVLLVADSLMEERKGMPLAIESLSLATRSLAKRGRGLVVDIVGSGDRELVERVTESGLDHHLHGRVDQPTLAALYARSDFVLTCSFEDNWPNILVEAGCHGCFPIVGPGHGCEEFVRLFGVGHVASDYTGEAFAELLIQCAERPAPWDRDSYSEAVRSAHAPAKVARDYLGVLQSMVH